MHTFDDIASGFDLELLLDEQILKALIQTFFDADPSLREDDLPLLKNFEQVTRDYEVDIPEPFQDDDFMQILNFADNETHLYVCISPLDLNNLSDLAGIDLSIFENLFFVLRLARSMDLPGLITDLQEAESEQAYELFQELIRLEGVISRAALDNVSDITENEQVFRDSVLLITGLFYNQLVEAQAEGNIDFPMLLEGAFAELSAGLLGKLEDYELFLMGIHNQSGISQMIHEALEGLHPELPFLPAPLHLHPFRDLNKIGFYGNLQTAVPRTHGSISNVQLFAEDGQSGLGLNLTENLLGDLFLAMMRFEMVKLLEEEEISEERFDEIDYSYPFAVPPEILEDLVDESTADTVGFFEINRIKLDTVRHKFEGQDERMDALEIELVLSNDASGFLEDVLDFFTPNPRLKIMLAFASEEEEDIQLLIDGDINVPFNLFTTLLLAPMLPLAGIFGVLGSAVGLNVISNIAVDALVGDSLEAEEETSQGIHLLRKRWDPFYWTRHQLALRMLEGTFNEAGQVKLIAAGRLRRSFEPYEGLYLQEVNFFSDDSLQNFTYRFSSVQDVDTATLPATDRMEDLYTLDSLERDLFVDMEQEPISSLLLRRLTNKLHSDIPYSPQFVRMENGRITRIRVLSDLRRDQIKRDLLRDYLEQEVQHILDLFFELIQELIPGYDTEAISDEQLVDITESLEELIRQSDGYAEYEEEGWEEDLADYLEEHPEDMLDLTPVQLSLLGLNENTREQVLDMVGLQPEELFDFLDLPGYQAVATGGTIFVRNIPNDTRGDNLMSLPEF